MSRARRPTVVCLVGPTAAGKTGVAVQLAHELPVEIISVDSAMVYRRMDIGTGKPSREILRGAPHRLIDVREPWESYSAGEFCQDAQAHMKQIIAAGRVPLLVGGTLLYFRALQTGLAPLPPADPRIRQELDERGDRDGWASLHAELEAVDAVAAARVDPADRQRIQRALEVYRITGEPISVLQQAATQAPQYRFVRIALVPSDRDRLYARIETRFRTMMVTGFLEEVAQLRALPAMHARRPSMRAVGYRQLWRCLQGELARPEAERQALVATRQLAKRQLTWLRSDADALTVDCVPPGMGEGVRRLIRESGLFDA